MKKFILSLIFFGLLFFVYDKLFIVFKNASSKKEVDNRLELVINGKMKKDIIVLGSSRGANNIIATQIEQKLKLSAYNLSYPASNVEFHEFILQSLVKFNHKPKIILLAIDDPLELQETNTQVFRYERLYPLVKYDYINNKLIERGEKNRFLSNIFVLHRINKTNLNLKQKKFTPEDTIMKCGSMPISFQKVNRKWVYENSNKIYDVKNEIPSKVKSFKNIVSICKQMKIKLVLITTPNFRNNNLLFEKRINQLIGNEVSVFYFDKNNAIYKNKDYFYDESHLNKKGASIFTNELVSYIENKVL